MWSRTFEDFVFFPLTAATVFLTATNVTATNDGAYSGDGDSDDDTYSDTLDTAKLEAEIRNLRLALGEMESEQDPSAPAAAEADPGRNSATDAAPLAARVAEQAEVRQTLVEYLNELKGVSGMGETLIEFPQNYSDLVESTYTVRAPARQLQQLGGTFEGPANRCIDTRTSTRACIHVPRTHTATECTILI